MRAYCSIVTPVQADGKRGDVVRLEPGRDAAGLWL